MPNTIDNTTAPEATVEEQSIVASQVPWWGVSLVFHVLVIALAGLLSMSISTPKQEEINTITEVVFDRPEIKQVVASEPPKATSVLESKKDIPPTDATAKEESNVLVTQEMLDQVKLGNHWQTFNPEATEDDGAQGTLDSKIFWTLKGTPPDEKAGGGGNYGLSLLEAPIGIGGMTSPGTGGGFGGGDGTGIGLGKGPGLGGFGKRGKGSREAMIKRYKGSDVTENAVRKALRWLARHQETDGHWNSQKYESGQKTDTACTALALLCFLGSGNTDRVGEHKETVRRAIAWLQGKQSADGLIFDTTDAGAHRGIGYPSAIATMAMAEAAGMNSKNEAARKSAQLAINYCTEKHQYGSGSDKLGFRYAPGTAGDISVTGWFVMAMKSAKIAGLHCNPMSMEGALRFLGTLERKAGGSAYGPVIEYDYTPGSGTNPRRCAIGNLIKQFTGSRKEELQSSVEHFMEKGGVPDWGVNGEKVDLYYWYYGTLCAFQQGGDVWNKWNNKMKVVLPENQCKDGDEAGSWKPIGEFSGEWGRVGQTALSCLCLEVYYRFDAVCR